MHHKLLFFSFLQRGLSGKITDIFLSKWRFLFCLSFFRKGQNICIFLCVCGKACFPCLQEYLVIFLAFSILKLTTLQLHEPFRCITHSISCNVKYRQHCIYSNFVLAINIYIPHTQPYIYTYMYEHM